MIIVGYFSLNKKALKALISKMDTKICAYSKRIALQKVDLRKYTQSIQDTVQIQKTRQAEEALNYIQDSLDCYVLLREYCNDLLQQVDNVDHMNVIFLNSCALKLQKLKAMSTELIERSAYVTDVKGNKFYCDLYKDLTIQEMEQLSNVIGKDIVQQLKENTQNAQN